MIDGVIAADSRWNSRRPRRRLPGPGGADQWLGFNPDQINRTSASQTFSVFYQLHEQKSGVQRPRGGAAPSAAVTEGNRRGAQ